MKVILDERETALYEKCVQILTTPGNCTYVQLSKMVLPIGDILFQTDDGKDVLIMERKSLPDLLSSIKDGRYAEQSHRLIHSSGFPPHSIIYIIEGMFSQLRTHVEKKMVLSAMTTLNFFKGFSVQRTSSVSETAELVIWMAEKIEKEFLKGNTPYYMNRHVQHSVPNVQPENVLVEDGAVEQINEPSIPNYCNFVKKVKNENITPHNIGEIILCQIPSVSSVTAIAIMKKFNNSFPQFMEELKANPECLNDIMGENNVGKLRKISKKCIENIVHFLVREPMTDFYLR